MKRMLVMMVVMALLAVSAGATTLPLVNPSFESPSTTTWTAYGQGPGGSLDWPSTGWTTYEWWCWGGVAATTAAVDGTQIGYMAYNGGGNTGGYTHCGVGQGIGTAIAGQTYTFSMYVGYDVTQDAGSTGEGQGDGLAADLNIAIDGQEVISLILSKAAGTLSGVLTLNTVSYTATAADAGKVLSVRLHGDNLAAAKNNQLFFDAASANVVPEPATMILLGLGGLLLSRRK